MGIVGCTYLEGFREEEALLDVVLGGVDGVDVLDARVAALHTTVPLDRLKCKGRNYNLQASFFCTVSRCHCNSNGQLTL